MLMINPENFRTRDSFHSRIVTPENIEQLLDSHVLEVRMANGNWWRLRRNGATKRWKREPNRFRIPTKAGLRSYGYITEKDFVNV